MADAGRAHRAAAELRRYGLRTATPALESPGPDPAAAKVLARMDADAGRIPFDRPDWHTGLADLDVPFTDYLDRHRPEAAVRASLIAEAFGLMGADEREYSALSLLHEFAGFGSAEAAFYGDSCRVEGGAGGLADAIAAELGDAVRLGTPVTAIATETDRCLVATAAGAIRARAVVVAAPVNTLDGIAFTPPVPLGEPHPGRVAKIWTEAGWPGAVESYTFTGPRGTAVVTFRLRAAADEMIEAYPGELLWHDWCADPYARGTWATSGPGQAARWHELADRSGPVFFAGGDISRRWVGWMDGAVTSGVDTADRAGRYLAGEPVPAARG